MNQKKNFFESDDRYYERNKNIISQNHNLFVKIIELSKSKSELRILEIGCGAGNLLKKYMKKRKI